MMEEPIPLSNEPHDEQPRLTLVGDIDNENLDRAVDTLATVLRDFGKYSFDMPESAAYLFGKQCEQWARHVLSATPPPGGPEPTRETGGKRNWQEIQTFFTRRRCSEQAYVNSSLSGLREIIWTCIHELNESALGDERADSRLRLQFERLEEAVNGNDLERLQREVTVSVGIMAQVLDERREQQRMQMEALYQRVRELDAQLEEARLEGAIDPLTQLFNRKTFDAHLIRTLDMYRVFDQSASLMIVDADHFKRVNDTYGHATGDRVLQQFADCMTIAFPHKWDHVARYGGEEFAVILWETSEDEARRLGERLLEALRRLRIPHNGEEITVTASLGLAMLHADDTPETWLARADRALYQAKETGRDRVCTI